MKAPKFLRRVDVESQVGLGRSTLYKLMSQGDFPRPYRITAGSVRWLQSDVDSWILNRIQPDIAADSRVA